MQEYLYQSMPFEQRQQLHLRIAERIADSSHTFFPFFLL
jgi:predicted ATPase